MELEVLSILGWMGRRRHGVSGAAAIEAGRLSE
jgi:hypothetical protein